MFVNKFPCACLQVWFESLSCFLNFKKQVKVFFTSMHHYNLSSLINIIDIIIIIIKTIILIMITLCWSEEWIRGTASNHVLRQVAHAVTLWLSFGSDFQSSIKVRKLLSLFHAFLFCKLTNFSVPAFKLDWNDLVAF